MYSSLVIKKTRNHETVSELYPWNISTSWFFYPADDFTQTNTGMNPPRGAQTLTNIASAAACASQCRQNSKFPCQGFYYCASVSTCVLRPTHADSSSSTNSALLCDHYSSTVHLLYKANPVFIYR